MAFLGVFQLLLLSFLALAFFKPAATFQTCIDNEKRSENKAACVGQPMGELVPYPGDCTRFLVCDCEYPTVRNCSPGLWFSNKVKVCDWPQRVDCKYGESISSTSTLSTTTIASTTATSPCEPPPYISASQCANYKDGTLLPYRFDCTAYINCTSSCPVLDYCPEDKVFNALLMICDTPDTAHCVNQPPPSTATPQTTPDTTVVITSTPDTSTGSTPDTTKNTTPVTTSDWTPVTTSAATTSGTTTSESNSSGTTPATTTTSEPTSSGTTPATTSALPPICETEIEGVESNFCHHNENGYYAYDYNCTAYIVCSAGCAELRYCQSGEVFNVLLGICDTAEDTSCLNLPYPTTTTTSESTTPTTEASTSDTTSVTLPTDVETICQNFPSHTLIPYPGYCQMYIECLDGAAKLQSCPEGWLFNPDLLICDRPEDVKCYEGGLTTPLPTTTHTPSSSTATSTTASLPSTTEVYERCLGQSNGTSFPYAQNCQWYYYCWGDDTSTLLPCPHNNWYNPQTGDCGPDVSHTACEEPVVPTTLAPAQLCKNQTPGTTFPKTDNCQQYIMCMGPDMYTVLNCPAKNYYNPASGNCGPGVSPTACEGQAAESTTTAMPSTAATMSTTTSTESTTAAPLFPVDSVCANAAADQSIAYPGNCGKYIVCSYPAPVAYYCLDDYYYNAITHTCEPNTSNNECIRPTTTTTTTTTTTSSTPTTESSTSTQQPEITDKSPCAGRSDGSKISYPENCHKYIVCRAPIPTAYFCDSGLEFNAEEQKCLEAAYANCSIKVPETTLAPTTMTTTTTAIDTTITPTTVVTTTETSPTTSPTLTCAGLPNGSTLPYPADCSSYIMCLGGSAQVLPCFPGTYYDKETGDCSRTASETACREESHSTATSTETTAETATQTTQITATTDDCNTSPEITTATMPTTTETTTATIPPITEPTTTSLTTAETTTPVATIPPITEPTTTTDTTTTTVASSTETMPTTTNTYPPTTETPAGPPMGPCFDKPENSLVPYPNNCSKFIVCEEPIPIGYDCPADLDFNAQLKQCMSPDQANCRPVSSTTVATTTDATATTESNICTQQPNGSTFPYANHCYGYIKCSDGVPAHILCPEFSYYNPAKGGCDADISATACLQVVTTTIVPPSTTLSPDTPNVCCGKPLETVLPYPGDETKFIVCRYPVPVVAACIGDTIYNESTQQCAEKM